VRRRMFAHGPHYNREHRASGSHARQDACAIRDLPLKTLRISHDFRRIIRFRGQSTAASSTSESRRRISRLAAVPRLETGRSHPPPQRLARLRFPPTRRCGSRQDRWGS
jgi:hypothetical protein